MILNAFAFNSFFFLFFSVLFSRVMRTDFFLVAEWISDDSDRICFQLFIFIFSVLFSREMRTDFLSVHKTSSVFLFCFPF